MCARAVRSARFLQNPRSDVASYCALPAESRSTSLSDRVTECCASFIGVHFRPEKPILLPRYARWTIRLHALSYVPITWQCSAQYIKYLAVSFAHLNNKQMKCDEHFIIYALIKYSTAIFACELHY